VIETKKTAKEDVEHAFYNDEICNADFGLQIIMVGVFTTTIWMDMVETVYMMVYVAKIPSSQTQGQVGKTTTMPGMPFWVKALIQITVYVPKLLIAEFLWYYGCGFLTLSKGMSELILNAVGMNFINQIDNYVYTGMVPKHMQTGMEKLNKRPIIYKIRQPFLHWLTNAMHLIVIPIILVGTVSSVVVLPYACPTIHKNFSAHWEGFGRFAMIALGMPTVNCSDGHWEQFDASFGLGSCGEGGGW
jgi:hypothetical protein